MYGTTGTGKSYTAKLLATYFAQANNMQAIWLKGDNSQWFDGYNKQKVVIIDDLRANRGNETNNFSFN